MGKKGSKGVHTTQIAAAAVIGAGASGCMAAVSAALEGGRVLLLDANDRICRKIYATGNGRCNLTNLHIAADCYHTGGGDDLSVFFSRFSVRDLMEFFESRGVYLHDRQGYVYPRTDQASTVAEAYDKILRELSVDVVLQQRVTGLSAIKEGKRDIYRIDTAGGNTYFAEKVILAGGGLAGPQYGCGEEMYRIAVSLGHSLRKPLPALVQLLSDDRNLKAAAGVRCDAMISLLCDGERICAERGELQMTDSGISGIPVFQLSSQAGRALDEGQDVEAAIDFLPGFSQEIWDKEMERRLGEERNCMLSVFFLGLVNRKILDLVLRRRGLQAENKASKLAEETLAGIMGDLRDFRIKIRGTGTFRQAQVTSGGIPLSETDSNLQSLKCKGLYLAGELLDVDGICGGYNLQWAMTSGWIAGKGAAGAAQDPAQK